MRTSEIVRALLEPWGELRPQPAEEWTGEAPLPDAVRDFYGEVGPVDLDVDCGGNPVHIPALDRLWALQTQYRWHGRTGARLTDWKDAWFVVAQAGGDPFILDVVTGQLFVARHGSPEWAPVLFAGNLMTGIGSIATVGNALSALGDDAYDETLELLPASRETVTNALAEFLAGDRDKAVAALRAWQWYE
jgi:hypothetical protein